MESTLNLLCGLIVICSFVVYKLVDFNIRLLDVSHYDSKPVIFGENLCPNIFHDNIVINEDFMGRFMYLLSPKVILRAKLEDQPIILKSLVRTKEMQSIEKEFYETFDHILNYSTNSFNFVKLQVLDLIRIPLGTALISKLRLCPYSANLDNLLSKIPESKAYQMQDYFELWTIARSNPEPLILKMLSGGDWPLPKYYGSCGRLIAVEDCGVTLTYLYDEPWVLRARITYQLLEAAFKFTFQDPDFGYYLTDISFDNIAVREGIAKFVDLENIIVVDKHPFLPEEQRKYNHCSKYYPCHNCFIFEADEVCQHVYSDHNFYGVCQQILTGNSLFPGGLLHSYPDHRDLDVLPPMIRNCSEAFGMTRFYAAQRIMSVLDKYLNDVL